MRKLTRQEFIEKAKLIHNDKYDYSKVDYVNNRTKVIIICKIHGDYSQLPSAHLLRQGCVKCCKKTAFNTKSFIKRCSEIHNNKYIYHNTKYVNSRTKVIITCKTHGDFEKTPIYHLKGIGCNQCNQALIKGKELFIKKANTVHHNKYNYSKVEYTGCFDKVIIVCPIHGEFLQKPSKHIQGQQCPKCAGVYRRTTSDFIEEANIIHNNKFTYKKTNFISLKKPVTITCKIHGDFKQRAEDHLNGSGCKKCSGCYKKSNDSFIKESNKVHNNKYCYKKTLYKNAKSKVTITCHFHGDFKITPTNHLHLKRGCKKCSTSISYLETEWLNSLNINFRQQKLPNLGLIVVDGYEPDTNTVYEFYGDYWHGNPNKFNANHKNKQVSKTFGELYQKTIEREKTIKKAGYNLVSIWESDYKKQRKNKALNLFLTALLVPD